MKKKRKKNTQKQYTYREIKLSKEVYELVRSFYLPEEVRQYIEPIDILSAQ